MTMPMTQEPIHDIMTCIDAVESTETLLEGLQVTITGSEPGYRIYGIALNLAAIKRYLKELQAQALQQTQAPQTQKLTGKE